MSKCLGVSKCVWCGLWRTHAGAYARINARVCWLLLHWPKTQPYERPRAINELGSVNKAVCTDFPSTRRYEIVTLLGLSFMMR